MNSVRRTNQRPRALDGITKPAIRRLARRAGTKRIANDVYEDVQKMLHAFLKPVLEDASKYADHARRKTITPMDVVNALRHQNVTFYGAGPAEPPMPKKKKKPVPPVTASTVSSSSSSSLSTSRTSGTSSRTSSNASGNRRPSQASRPSIGSLHLNSLFGFGNQSQNGSRMSSTSGSSASSGSRRSSQASRPSIGSLHLNSLFGNQSQGSFLDFLDNDPGEVIQLPQSPRDPYFGSISQLKQDIMRAVPSVTDVQVWDKDQLRANIDDWFASTSDLRNEVEVTINRKKIRYTGCPRLEKKQMRRALIDDDEDFRIYNVYTNQGLAAFLILTQMEYENEEFVYVDFACSYHLTGGIAKTFMRKLKNSGRKILLDAILQSPLKGLKFWWKQGFRTGNAAIDAYFAENLSNESLVYHTEVEKFLRKAEGFNFKQDYKDNSDLLKMRYPL